MSLHERLSRVIDRVIRDELEQRYANTEDRNEALVAALTTAVIDALQLSDEEDVDCELGQDSTKDERSDDYIAPIPTEQQYAQWNAARWND